MSDVDEDIVYYSKRFVSGGIEITVGTADGGFGTGKALSEAAAKAIAVEAAQEQAAEASKPSKRSAAKADSG